MEDALRRGFLRDDLDPAAWWGLIGFFIDSLFPPDALRA